MAKNSLVILSMKMHRPGVRKKLYQRCKKNISKMTVHISDSKFQKYEYNSTLKHAITTSFSYRTPTHTHTDTIFALFHFLVVIGRSSKTFLHFKDI